MSHLKRILCIAALLSVATTAWGAVPALINFQGVLNTPGGPPVADANYSVTFAIYPTPTGGVVLWSESQSVTTSGGVFSVLLGSNNPLPDSAFADSARYLGVTVSPDPEMTPRQKISSVAYSQRVGSLMGATGGLSVEEGDPGDTTFVSLLDDGTPGIDMLCPTPPPVVGPCPPWALTTVGTPSNPPGMRAGMLRVLDCNGVQTFRVNGWSGDVFARGKATFGWGTNNAGFYGFAAGAYNITTPNTKMPTIPGGYCNVASHDYTTVGGGTNNTSSGIYGTVGGGQGNTSTFQGATVSGGELNRSNNLHATVGGGMTNSANGVISTVDGGMDNMAADTGTTVGGGLRNGAMLTFATVAGGQRDTASGGWSTVSGGRGNLASAGWSVVSGGDGNRATGTYACIPGGSRNIASGAGSLASGSDFSYRS